MTMYRFPNNFLWGAATSAIQIEGGSREDGKGECIWMRFASIPGNIVDGTTFDVACDHYHRFREDVKMMKELGIKAYRFSISWPRVLPEGTGVLNQKGLDFYERLVDELLRAGIQPFATLYHWDLPVVLQEKGGWEKGGWVSRDTAYAFCEYTEVVTKYLGDRIKHWMTLNEPSCSAVLGHETGAHAPGIKNFGASLRAAHHLLLAHGLAIPIIRANSSGCEAGIVLHLTSTYPLSLGERDIEAARRSDGHNRWYLDPLFKAEYPLDMQWRYVEKERLLSWDELSRFVKEDDLKIIAVPTDFLGINYYSRSWGYDPANAKALDSPQIVYSAPRSEWTDMGWEIYPNGLYDLLRRVHAEYHPPKIYVTENGAAYPEMAVGVRQIRYLRDHLQVVHWAISDGVPVKGYFVWSFLDNLEWTWGASKRFGIVHVNYETQERLPKSSAHWYSRVIHNNGFYN